MENGIKILIVLLSIDLIYRTGDHLFSFLRNKYLTLVEEKKRKREELRKRVSGRNLLASTTALAELLKTVKHDNTPRRIRLWNRILRWLEDKSESERDE